MVSSHVIEILERLRKEKSPLALPGPVVSVHKLTSRAGAFYEKVRYMVEYKDEHTIRRSAIERILKRKFSFEKEKHIGMSFLEELVQAEYLPNDRVPEMLALDVQSIIDKYWMLAAAMEGRRNRKRKRKLSDTEKTVLSLAASEIDRVLFPRTLDDAVTESFYKAIKGVIRCSPSVPEKKCRASLYIACRRSILGDDAPTLLYVLVSKYAPEIVGAEGADRILPLAAHVSKAIVKARHDLDNPLVWRIMAAVRNQALGFSVVREVIKKHGLDAERVFGDPKRLESETKQILSEKYVKQNHLVWLGGIHAAIYLLLTKSILAFFLEIPYELYVHHSVDIFALSVNIIFHPVLLLLMVQAIRPLDSRNMLRTLAEVREIAYGEEERIIHIKAPEKRGTFIVVLGLLYTALFAVTFGTIVRVLLWMHFSAMSIILFLFFLALVSYFGLRIRHKAERWKISAPNENAASLLWNFFTLPIIRTGRWLAKKFAALNVFIFVMDFIIETPFKIMLGTFDSFLSFLKEKEEDMD